MDDTDSLLDGISAEQDDQEKQHLIDQVDMTDAIHHYEFYWSNLRLVALTQALPEVLDFFLVSQSFHLVNLANLNDSYISGLFAMTSIYCAMLFYLTFSEALGFA